jgi:uracil-DNA glycosylase family 4
MGREKDRAMVLAREYLRQLGEAGESEIYLPKARARAIREQGRDEPRAAAAPSRARGDVPSSDSAPGAPEVEVVPVKLPFTQQATTADMFAPGSGLEPCTTLDEVEAIASVCTKCELAKGRTKVVFGVGDPNARLLFIGEAPGRDEDIQGVPFVGRAGQLLNKILDAAEIARDDVYIANIIKCRPPNNRTPFTNEIESCIPYLARQVALIAPRIICTLGLPATQTLLGIRGSMGSLRGKMYVDGDVRVIPTYHPAAALRDPKYKRPIWDDFLLLRREYKKV